MIWLGLVLAIASSVAINGGYTLQHRHASSLSPLSLRRPVASLAALLIAGEPRPGEFEKRAGTLRRIENLSTNDLEELLRRKKAKAAN